MSAVRNRLSQMMAVNKSLLLPSEGVLSNLSKLECEILSSRLSSPNYKPFVPAESLFDKLSVQQMIPRYLLVEEDAFKRELQKTMKQIELRKIQRASQILPALPRLPDEITSEADLNPTRKEENKKLQLRGLRIANEIEKQLIKILSEDSFKISLPDDHKWGISRVVSNLEITKVVIYYSVQEIGKSCNELKDMAEALQERLDAKLKLYRFQIAQRVYLKRVPFIEFKWDKEIDLSSL